MLAIIQANKAGRSLEAAEVIVGLQLQEPRPAKAGTPTVL
jgi:hypothetical protein